jgi:hypothetical protein
VADENCAVCAARSLWDAAYEANQRRRTERDPNDCPPEIVYWADRHTDEHIAALDAHEDAQIRSGGPWERERD